MDERLSLSETARLCRAALEAAFPGVEFLIIEEPETEDRYVGLQVAWMRRADFYPDIPFVEKVAKAFEGMGRKWDLDEDGEEDVFLSWPVYAIGAAGQRIRYGADVVICSGLGPADGTEGGKSLSQLLAEADAIGHAMFADAEANPEQVIRDFLAGVEDDDPAPGTLDDDDGPLGEARRRGLL